MCKSNKWSCEEDFALDISLCTYVQDFSKRAGMKRYCMLRGICARIRQKKNKRTSVQNPMLSENWCKIKFCLRGGW